VLAGCSFEVAEAITRAAARLHTAWQRRPNPQLPIVLDRIDRPLEPTVIEAVVDGHGAVLSRAGIDLLRSLPDRLPGAFTRLRRQPPTVLHADLHLDNVLLSESGPILLDWANVRWGPAAIDVARCLLEFGEGTDRRLLDVYCEETHLSGDDVDAALIASLPPMLRWASRKAPTPGTREHALLGHTLRRYEAALT